MRRAAMLLVLLLPFGGCAGGPSALGITGPQQGALTAEPAAKPAVDPLDNPETLQSGIRYGPGSGPTTGGGHFWGYD